MMVRRAARAVVLLGSIAAVAHGTTYCDTQGDDYSYVESFADSGATRKVTFSSCPNHRFTNKVGDNNNKAIKQSKTLRIPRYPMYDASTETDLLEFSQMIGVTRAGSRVFSPYVNDEVGRADSYATSAPKQEGDTFDECGGHSTRSSSPSYGTHIPPSCLLFQLNQTDTAHSPMIGWAVDGFPIYGPRGPGGVMMQTCAETGGTIGVDLCTDNCTGYWNDTLGDGYKYRYYLLGEYYAQSEACTVPIQGWGGSSFYPFTSACLRGCCPSDATCDWAGDLPSCSACLSIGSKGWIVGRGLAHIDTSPCTLICHWSWCLRLAAGNAVAGYTAQSEVLRAVDALPVNEEACSTVDYGDDNDEYDFIGTIPVAMIIVFVLLGVACLCAFFGPTRRVLGPNPVTTSEPELEAGLESPVASPVHASRKSVGKTTPTRSSDSAARALKLESPQGDNGGAQRASWEAEMVRPARRLRPSPSADGKRPSKSKAGKSDMEV